MRAFTEKTGIDQGRLLIVLRDMVSSREGFDHTEWPMWAADTMESFAKMIRAGYKAEDEEGRNAHDRGD